MMTSSNGNIFRVGYWPFVRGIHRSFPAQRPVTRNFDVSFDLRLNKRLSKQSWGWWFETPSHPLWRHRNVKCWFCVASEQLRPKLSRENRKTRPVIKRTTLSSTILFAYALTHWGRAKMASIFQTTFSNAFSWMKTYEFRLGFHWSLFPGVQLTIFHRWFR